MFTIVLIPKDAPHVIAAVKQLLDPYNRHLEVPPHEAPCWCVNLLARRHGDEVAKRTVADLGDLRTRYWSLPEGERPGWETYIAEWLKVAEHTEREHPLHGQPDPQGKDCHGSGRRLTTCNPQGKWDSWRIGGRWDGAVAGRRRRGKDGFNFGPEHERLSGNVVPVARLRATPIPFALVTPDGAWHQETTVNLSTWTAQQDPDWPQKVRTLFAQHRHCLAVGCELHF